MLPGNPGPPPDDRRGRNASDRHQGQSERGPRSLRAAPDVAPRVVRDRISADSSDVALAQFRLQGLVELTAWFPGEELPYLNTLRMGISNGIPTAPQCGLSSRRTVDAHRHHHARAPRIQPVSSPDGPGVPLRAATADGPDLGRRSFRPLLSSRLAASWVSPGTVPASVRVVGPRCVTWFT